MRRNFSSLARVLVFRRLATCLPVRSGASRSGRGVTKSWNRHSLITQHAFGFPMSRPGARMGTLRLDALLYGCLLAIVLNSPARRTWATARMNRSGASGVHCDCRGNCRRCQIQDLGWRRIFEAMSIPIMLVSTVLAPYTALGRLLESSLLVWWDASRTRFICGTLFSTRSWSATWCVRSGPIALLSILVCAMISFYGIERPSCGWVTDSLPPVTPRPTRHSRVRRTRGRCSRVPYDCRRGLWRGEPGIDLQHASSPGC